jgi:hypothetical protein
MQSLGQLRAAMLAHNVRRLLVKPLAPNDNSKNQVYLGGDLGVVNVIPASEPEAAATGKHNSPIFKAPMSFSWLDEQGNACRAPLAQMILYPQYPEVRFSGFLRGAEWAPSAVMTSRDPGRILVLGIGNDGNVFGFAANHDSAVSREIGDLGELESDGVFREIPLGADRTESRTRLLRSLCGIAQKGWIDPWRLGPDNLRLPCKGTNCVGVTLESELGITANGRSEPDFDGWEVKGHTVTNLERPGTGVITLLTPEPNGGYYATEGAAAFVRKYGYADLLGREDRINFGGIHRVGMRAPRTGLSLHLDGFDVPTGTMMNAFGALQLIDDKGNVTAAWSFAGILAHWTRKHSKAAFVPATQRNEGQTQFRYGERVLLAEGTDYLRLLEALAAGYVYLDPGIKIENASTLPKLKRRNQFRVKFGDLKHLYHKTSEQLACAD